MSDLDDMELMDLALRGKHTHKFRDGEMLFFSYHKGMCGSFYSSLWKTIARADERNLDKLSRGYPEEVLAYRSWIHGNLAERLRAHQDEEEQQ